MKGRFFMGSMLIGLTLLLTSCGENMQSDNQWIDTIHLSKHHSEFSASGDSVIITTKGTRWSVSDVLINGNYLVYEPNETRREQFVINGGWFSIERVNSQQFIVRASENNSFTQRNIKIALQADEFVDIVDINQSPCF